VKEYFEKHKTNLIMVFSAICNKTTHNGEDRFLIKKINKIYRLHNRLKSSLLLNARTRAMRGKNIFG
jgi:hypothetical protein